MKPRNILLVIALALGIIAIFAPIKGRVELPVGSPLNPNLGVEDPSAAKNLVLRQQKDHPVTPEMTRVAASLGAKTAPPFRLSSVDGGDCDLASLSGDRPLLIFFIEKQCPCCLGAKKFVDDLVALYPDHLNVVGIINADQKVASAWKLATRPKFRLLLDPHQTAIRAYKAERGVYTTLVAPGGQIDKAYPGYSLEMLQDVSNRVARLAHVKAKTVLSKEAPTTLTSGCLFPDPEEKSL